MENNIVSTPEYTVTKIGDVTNGRQSYKVTDNERKKVYIKSVAEQDSDTYEKGQKAAVDLYTNAESLVDKKELRKNALIGSAAGFVIGGLIGYKIPKKPLFKGMLSTVGAMGGVAAGALGGVVASCNQLGSMVKQSLSLKNLDIKTESVENMEKMPDRHKGENALD